MIYMIKCKSLQKKTAIAAVAGILMLLLAATCLAQTPLDMGAPANCTDCSANASAGPAGSSSMIDLSSASVSLALEPPELVSPSGVLNTGRPTYTWYGADDCRYYGLEVRDEAGDVVLKHWYDALDFDLPPETCSVTPLETLEPGDYTWSILCWNCTDSQISQEMDFTVCTSTSFPGKAILVSPKDVAGSMNPTFVWKSVPGCTRYCLKVADAKYQNEPIFIGCYDAEEVISGERCSITPVLDLVEGSYRWWIQTINCKGDGPWSNYMSFKYQNRPPGMCSPVSPSGLVTGTMPTFVWTAALAATQYHLQVDNNSQNVIDEWFDAEDVTHGLRCSSTLLEALPSDDAIYYWRISASNDAGQGAWSRYRYFETICPYKPGAAKKKVRMR
jgi:hypothetical protein